MTRKPKIACIVGTRPEVIKMSPLIKRLKKENHFAVSVINTGQHRELTAAMLALFDIKPDLQLDVMQPNQSLSSLTSILFAKLGTLIESERYNLILAQGDTTTTYVAAQVAFYNKIVFGHIEAGLRSFDLYHPFPEEMNRVLISRTANWHFAPTTVEELILLKEGVKPESIYVTGNTGIDALLMMAKRHLPLPIAIPDHLRLILVTLHRRESFGEPLKAIFSALLSLAEKHPDICFVFPVHPNPNVTQLAQSMLKDHPHIFLIPPQPYDAFVALIKASYLILTDSGGLQEEAPALNKPVLILREVTERQLVIEAGVGLLLGNDKDYIIKTVSEFLTDPKRYQAFQKNISPYGDGHATDKIVAVIEAHFADSLMRV